MFPRRSLNTLKKTNFIQKIKVAPSILAADYSHLAKDIKKVEAAGCDLLHIDVMDGHFVPNITIGPMVVKAIRKITKLPLHSHLMIENPFRYINEFIDAGSDIITVHIETVTKNEINKYKKTVNARGVKLGVSLNPATPVERILPLAGSLDWVLVMSVNPGFGGQEFIPSVIPKIKKLRGVYSCDIEVDGGVNDKNAPLLIEAGANVMAAGTYIFKAKNTKQAMEKLRR